MNQQKKPLNGLIIITLRLNIGWIAERKITKISTNPDRVRRKVIVDDNIKEKAFCMCHELLEFGEKLNNKIDTKIDNVTSRLVDIIG
jgi:hypothetical protein